MIRRILFRFRAFFILSSSIVLLTLGLSVMLFPFQEIEELRTGYFIVHPKGKNLPAEYEIVKSRPKKWVKLESISPAAYRAIMLSEDFRFYKHYGIDFLQIKHSLIGSKKLGRARSLSQQLANSLFINNDKTFFRKIMEVPMAIYLDWRLPKKKILEAYLNSIKFGDQVYGIADASRVYYDKLPSTLSMREGANLAILLSDPEHSSLLFQQENLSIYTDKLVFRIMKRMVQAGFITEGQFESQTGKTYAWEDQDEDEFEWPSLAREVSN